MAKKISLEDISGFKITAIKAGLKKSGKPDLGIIVADDYATGAGVFTTNKVCAAPVKISRDNLKKSKGKLKAILVNAGNANACTGKQGMDNTRECVKYLAGNIGCKGENVFVCSTGIIGEQLPMVKFRSGLEKASRLIASGKSEEKFAKAIMTTDLVHKETGVTVNIGNKKVTIAGAAKGVGMLAPNMATMLGFMLTDINISSAALQAILKDVVAETFNCVTVDGDTSTNDSCLILASGRAGNKIITSSKSKDALKFKAALKEVAYELSRKIAADGEGASTLIQVLVNNAASKRDAEVIARSIAESPLVKTAVAGNDPNWGRIMMAVGKSGAKVREEKVSVKIAGIKLFEKGTPLDFSRSKASKAMSAKEISIIVDLGLGKGNAEMLTCDFTHGYIEINADYHT